MKREETNRLYGLDVLKIVAIFLIVLFHVVQTLSSPHIGLDINHEAFVNIGSVTDRMDLLVLAFFGYFGSIGNDMFLIISCWFLVYRKKQDYKKVFQMMIEVWLISVIFALVFYASGRRVDLGTLIFQFLPTTFANNWYITCYILLFMIYPFLNIVIFSVSRKTLLNICLISVFLYSILGTFFSILQGGLFFRSMLIDFVVIYFLIAYIRIYKSESINNQKRNLKFLGISILLLIIVICITNYLGRFFNIFSNGLLMWAGNISPFVLAIAISSFFLFRNLKITRSKMVWVSKLSLLIYVIHENMLFRDYIRPYIFEMIFNSMGYGHLVLIVIGLAAVLFVGSAVLAYIFRALTKNWIWKLAGRIDLVIRSAMNKLDKIFY